MKVFKMTRGFTLIELLVVIAIIGGLSSLLVPNFMAARERARDAQRKSDIKQIQQALELYKQNQTAPAYLPTASYSGISGSQWVSGTTVYMNKVPEDPNRTPAEYSYQRPKPGSTDTLTFELCACLENPSDPGGVAGNCSATYICSSGKKYVINEP